MDNKYEFCTLRQLLQEFRVIRLLVLLIICIMSIVLISGCSFQGKVPLSFIVQEDEILVWERLIAQFHDKHPNIEIKPEVLKQDSRKGTEQLKQKLLCALGTEQLKQNLNCPSDNNKFYDLLYLDIIWVPEFVSQGWLKDLTKEFPPKDLEKEFLISEVENGCYGDPKGCEGNDQHGKGKLYRVPFRTDIGLLYYRKDLLEEVKKDLRDQVQAKPPETFKIPPETFEDLTKIAGYLQKKYQKPDKKFWGYLWPGDKEALIAMFTEVLHGYRGYWINKDWIRNESEKNTKVVEHDEQCQQNNSKQSDKCKVVALDEQQAIDAVKFLHDTIYSYNISPRELLSFTDPDLDILKIFLAEPDAVFMRNWPFAWAKAYESESLRGKIDFIPMVHAEGQTSGASKGGWGFGVAEKTKHPKQAIEAIKFFTSAPAQRQFALHYSSVPSLRRLFYDPQIVSRYRHYPKLLDLIERKQDKGEWIARPRIPEYAQVSCILQKYLSKALKKPGDDGHLEPKAAMKQAADETRKLLDSKPQELPNIEKLECK